jgi:signal recognition particle subunit SRP54
VSRSPPGQVFVKISRAELEAVAEGLNLAVTPPTLILMAGLQGAGKTTSVAKLGKRRAGG